MILDEPSAALDPLSEAQVYELFHRILDGRIGIVITHRLGSIRFADRILVLKGGSVVGIGDHDSLMHAGGYYRELYMTQSGNYVRNGPPA